MTDMSPYPSRAEVPTLEDLVATVTCLWQGEADAKHLTTNTVKYVPLLSLPFPFTVLGVGFAFNNALAASASDYWSFTLGNTPSQPMSDPINWYAEYTTKPITDGGVLGGGGAIAARKAWWPEPVWKDSVNGPKIPGGGALYLQAKGVGNPGNLNGPAAVFIRYARS